MNKLFKGILLAATAIMLLSSCKSTRPLIKAPLKEKGPDYLYRKLKENELRFDWLTLKFDARYTKNKSSNDFKGQIRIRKDSLLWVSITPALGIELFRMIITNDSIKYINRLDKEYFLGDFTLVRRFFQINIDFDILQSLILGNDFQFYETNSFRASIDAQQASVLEYRLSTTGRHKIKKEAEETGDAPTVLLQNIWLNPESYKITRLDVKEYLKDNRKLSATFDDFVKLDSQLYPSVLNFDLIADDDIKIRINYNKAAINEPMSFPFSIPKNYKRIE